MLEPGKRLGHFQIIAALGAGGMGEVYQAKDTRLDRTVAIKILPEHFAESPERRARFEREAKAISNLNHPHICTLYDVGEEDGINFLVMEYIEGKTLAERLVKGPLTVAEALEYGIQIANALDRAHREGVIHRDLKPGNVMLCKAGVKLLDFGLAKQTPIDIEPDSGFPTQQKHLTQGGTIVGTLQYMAPEQIEGKPTDHRTDVFAFGTTFYEMVSGRTAFDGRSPVSLIANIVDHHPPPLSTLQPMSPTMLDRVIKRCLAKDPEERWQSARDLSEQLKWIADGVTETGGTSAVARGTQRVRARVLVAATVAIAAGVATWSLTRASVSGPGAPIRLEVSLPEDQSLTAGLFPSVAITPDGTRVVFQGEADGVSQLYLRSLDDFEAHPIAGTEGAHTPFVSPDAQWIGFMADAKLKKVPIAGGAPLTVCDARSLSPGSPGATWREDGTIVFAAGISGLMRVSAMGGTAEPLTTPDPDRGEINHFEPQFLPDGEHVLFSIRTGEDEVRLAVLSLESLEWEWLSPLGEVAGTRYVRSDHLVFAQAGALWAVPFDVTSHEFTGAPFPLLEDVYTRAVADAVVTHFAVSKNGVLAYVSGRAPEQTVVLVDRAGRAKPLLGDSRTHRYPRFSADGTQVALTIESERGDIYVVDVQRRTLRRLTRTGTSTHPIWTGDGKHVTFASRRPGSDAYDIYWVPADESEETELLMQRKNSQFPSGWSPDGKVLAFYEISNETARDAWTMSMDDKSTRQIAVTTSNERVPTFSPDGNWLVYVSDESGRDEVYVRHYPGPGAREVISSNGGTEPVWSPTGREIFYRKGNQMLAVPVRTQPTFHAEAPRVLFVEPYMLSATAVGRPNYDVSADGQSLVMIRRESDPRHVHVVLNWFEEIESRDSTDD